MNRKLGFARDTSKKAKAKDRGPVRRTMSPPPPSPHGLPRLRVLAAAFFLILPCHCSALLSAVMTMTKLPIHTHMGITGTRSEATTMVIPPSLASSCSDPLPKPRRSTATTVVFLHAVPKSDEDEDMQDDRINRRPTSSSTNSSDNRTGMRNKRNHLRPGSMEAAIAETGRVPYGEESRKYRRTVYGHSDWVKHRSNERFLTNLLTIFSSGVVRQLAFEVTLVMASALTVCAYNAVAGGYVDLSGTHHPGFLVEDGGLESTLLATLPTLPFTLASPALGLLLVFRTNASYGRWMEARATWGRVSAQCKNVMRMAATWSDAGGLDEDDVAATDAALADLSVRTYIFARTLQRHLRGPDEEESYVRDVGETSGLPQADASDLLSSRNRVTWAIQDLSRSIDRLPIDEKRRVEIDKSVVILCEAVGTCEKIFTSPIPLVYTRHTARFLAGYLLLLPMGLWENFGGTWNHLGVVPVSAVIAVFLFGIEELSIQLEEPFSILPLGHLVDGIRDSGEEARLWFSKSRSRGDDDDDDGPRTGGDGLINDAMPREWTVWRRMV